MAPTPQEHAVTQQEVLAPVVDGNRIVISGMSGLYPQSHHVKQLSEMLYNKVNPIGEDSKRWKYNHPEVAQHTGMIPELERFDAQFFKVHYRLGNSMDPMSRKILEQAYNAIYDAGVSPEHLSGKKIGVFIGSCFSEAEKACFYDAGSRSGFGITGCCKAMFANRISYWLNAKGPSMSIDEACCSSAAALEQAYLSMSRGDCEGAIVGGSYLCLHPQSSVHYGRIMKQAMDGKTRSFDQNADGTVKSEAINVLFLQKANDAKRIYADLLHAKTEFIGIPRDETGPKYGFLRNPDAVVNFLKTFYEEARVPPHAVEYVEAFGSAVPEADKAELDAFDKVFCKEKDDTLLVGTITSNIGYGEAASGISGITKVLLGYHTGQLAANLHCEQPRQDVKALRDGRMKIITEHQPFGRTYAAVNGMSVTGVNSHVLLHGHYKPKDLLRYKSNIAHLVTISARQDTVVKNVIDNLKSRPIDPEELALLHNIHQTKISGHLGRGYVILDTKEEKTVGLAEKAEYFDDARRPLWFVYSGMGSQWAGMGAQLMRIPIFAAAIERCRRALEPKGIDIVHIITTDDDKIFDNILHSFVGIAAVQIGLTDILRELGLVPDGIIGHSVGELGCAYADGCLTAEEMILSAYSRGLVSLQTPFIRGSMAAVGVGYDKISKIIPPEIEVACHNGPESSTISGPADVMKTFVAELTAKGIFAKEVPCSNIAYHSRYIADAGPGLLKYLKDVIKTPRQRSERWVSTSVPKDRWTEDLAQYSSAEYHTNNLLCPVLFEETLPNVPSNAVLVEVAPHGLLQAILKRSLPEDCRNIALTRRKHADNTFLLLDAIGKLYMEGYNPKVDVLYPKVEMPVSTGTPLLSHLSEWAHTEKWAMPLYRTAARKIAPVCNFKISLHDLENEYLRGNIIREKTVYPFAAALVAVWDTLAMLINVPKKELSVEFHDVQLNVQPALHEQSQLRLSVTVQRGTGKFEVLDDNIKIATGTITSSKCSDVTKHENENNETPKDMNLSSSEIYALLKDRDYSYSGEFQSIEQANSSLNEANLVWRNNWVTLIDGMMQLNVLRQSHDTVSNPTHIRRICINVDKHTETVGALPKGASTLKAEINETYDFTRCGGIMIEDIRFQNLPALANNKMELQSLQFIQNGQTNLDVATSLLVFLQIVAENINKQVLKIVGITNCSTEGSVFDLIKNIDTNAFGVNIQYEQVNQQSSMKNRDLINEADAVLINNLSTDEHVCQQLHNVLKPNVFIISEEDKMFGNRTRPSSLYRVLSTLSGDRSSQSRLQLIRWRPTPSAPVGTAVTVRSPTDYALLSSARANLPSTHRLLVFSSYPAPTGLKNLIQSWRNEADRNMVQLVMVNNEGGNLFVDELPEIDLAFSVVDQCKWGGEYYLPVHQNAIASNNVMLKSSRIGDFNSLYWTEGPEIEKNGLTVNVHYAGIGNTDIKKANGTIPFEKDALNCFGMDFSGTTPSGERVMGLAVGGAASTQLQAQPELLWPVPAHWTLEEAATVPFAYLHALYCLNLKSKLLPRDNILIHGGCGAVGQAAIAIALSLGCQVFTTVSDIRKKRFLLKMFPQLKEEYIGNSRDDTFADMVMTATKGEGCSVVISSLKPELKLAAIKCVASCGHLLDLTQIHGKDLYSYGMNYLKGERAYITADMSSIFKKENINELRQIHAMLSDGIVRGYVRPLSRVTYEPKDTTRAFRMLAESRHRGRVLLQIKNSTPTAQKIRVTCDPELSQLILCDEEKFGIKLADRLVERGAKKLHILYKAYATAEFQFKLRSWQRNGIQVQVSSDNLNTEKDVRKLINDAKRLGSLQGVYAVVGAEQNVHESVFTALDSTTRTLCPSLRYFAVINMNKNTCGHATCVSRERSKLPATMISLPQFGNGTDMSWRDALDATEQALRVSKPVLTTRPVPQQKPSLLEQIASIAGITITEDTPKTATLEELGVQEDKLKAIGTFLRFIYNVTFTEVLLPQTTLQTLIRLEETDFSFEEIKGLKTFYSYVDSDELMATTEIVFLPTVTTGAHMRDDEFDASQPYLSIVPGMEGHHERFRVLCERLKLPALVLQPGLDHPQETVRDTAERFAEFLMTKTAVKDNFYLLGYESGVLVALEIASILEDYGLAGTVFCIGHAPDELKRVVEDTLSEYKTEEELQDGVVRHMFQLMGGADLVGLDKALQKANTWQQKVEGCMQFLRGNVTHSVQYARALIESALMRIKQAQKHNAAARPLRSRIVLLRAATEHTSDVTSLQQHSQQPVTVHQLSAPLAHAADDTRCAAIVNAALDPEILTAFEKRNLCEAYLLNPNSFMSVQNENE
ncbi:fatty acid synthase-like [Anticarsia gemmatalis]|uniref:fatty acid synthase-like n=1 Tax=Anticarsia gemmatalis TaxID=129554 RepID=UPI003F77613D